MKSAFLCSSKAAASLYTSQRWNDPGASWSALTEKPRQPDWVRLFLACCFRRSAKVSAFSGATTRLTATMYIRDFLLGGGW